MIKNIELKAAGVVSAGMVALLIFVQIQGMKTALSGISGGETVPGYFYSVMDFFAIAIFLLGVGCVFKSMSGIGVIFAAFQISLLVALIQGVPPLPLILGLIVASILFLEVSQMLIYVSEVSETTSVIAENASERTRLQYYMNSLQCLNPEAAKKIERSKKAGISLNYSRMLVVWAAVAFTLLLSEIFLGDDSVSYVSLLFFVVFPMSVIALVIQRRKSDEED